MDWHRRYLQQAAWTRDLRLYLFEHAGLKKALRVLEIGCGTGAVLADLDTPASIFGLDVDFLRLDGAKSHVPAAVLTCGNALGLPYSPGVFDLTFCHFLLLWVGDPLQALREMKRVTRPGGSVLALAEPDYNSRLDEPQTLAPLGCWQAESLQRQGADTGLGARLAALFNEAGIQLIETGPLTMGGEHPPSTAERDLEWEVLESDLEGRVPARDILRLKRMDERAWEKGGRVLHVPTYFAWGNA